MKVIAKYAVITLIVSILLSLPVLAEPVAIVPNARYEFEPVLEGTEILHDFVIKNTGDAQLDISRVKAGCGCTTVSYSEHISAGGEGKISIKINSNGYGGRRITKSVSVYTNDPKNSRFGLGISGKVNSFAKIMPQRVKLNGIVGQKIQSRVTIIPEKQYPFDILKAYVDKGDRIKFVLNKVSDGYVLIVDIAAETPGRYWDRIHLKTDSKAKPDISIPVYGNIAPATQEK